MVQGSNATSIVTVRIKKCLSDRFKDRLMITKPTKVAIGKNRVTDCVSVANPKAIPAAHDQTILLRVRVFIEHKRNPDSRNMKMVS